MRNERLLRLVGTEERPLVDTYHDRIRETVLGQMDEESCKAIHRSLADVIETNACGVSAESITALENDASDLQDAARLTPRIYDLAYHFDAAGEKRKAWVYALLAAEQARRQSALEVAVNNYAVAIRNANGTSNALNYRIAKGCSQALMLLGRYEDANLQLDGATDLTNDNERKAQIELLQGEILFRQGLMKQSGSILEQGLRRIGVWVPKTMFGRAYGIIRAVLIQTMHTLMPFLLHRKASTSHAELAVQFLTELPHAYIYQNTTRMLWAHLAGMNRAERLPPSLRLVTAYGCHSTVTSMLGWRSRGERYGDRALALARKLDDLLGQGQAHYYHGIGLYAAARYEDGLEKLGEAIRLLHRAGDQYALHLSRFHKGCCQLGLGNLAEAVVEARETFASSARLGDSRVLCSSYLWARVTRGNFPFEQLRSCYPYHPDDIMSTVHGIMAEGHWHTFHGRTEDSLQAFEQASAMVRKSFCVNSHMILVLPELAGALRRHADAIQDSDPKKANYLRKRAHRLSKWATRLTRFFPAAYPLALRERSLILASYGKTKKALRFAAKSCAVAEAQKAKYEHTQSLLVRGKLAKELGLPEADEQIRTAEAAMEEIERPIRDANRNPGDSKAERRP
jgi:tetratricopeptide (TPR) repeat protein